MKNGNNHPKVVIIGGGTGTFVVLSGLKDLPLELNAVITMMDSGGSTGKLRDQYGVLPPGDIRQALVALSHSEKIWRELFLYRFVEGDFAGHNFGNLFLSVLERITGNFEKAIEMAQTVLHTQGQIIPITLDNTHIHARLKDGQIIHTEALIDRQEERPAIEQLFLDHPSRPNPKAIAAITESDYIVVGPGDLYTSILPNFLFPQIKEAFLQSSAKKILIMNLMNKLGQTDNFRASDYLAVYKKHLGQFPFTHLLINNAPIPTAAKRHYEAVGEDEVIDNLEPNPHYKLIRTNLLNEELVQKQGGDKLSRSLLRHDENKVAHTLDREIFHIH